MNKPAPIHQLLLPELKDAIKLLFNTKSQCREMLQLVDNLNSHMDTPQHKARHAQQQDFWASNLVHVSEHLAAMEESVRQIESGRIDPDDTMRQSVLTVVDQAQEFAEHIAKIYNQVMISIAPIEAELEREIAAAQRAH
ncbi:MAG: hypothetical protein IBX50_12125 [Marinospirillum sp.]|uniref:hypothetical protein n=1 Tax=Marinospirillum sp. TaxID=2183934 RepID=UPI0019F7A9A3|nr:hypothetical protein [Marinospirillum sp.]MBE0507443.1 hypothetical protein [Marinospirillum sp.]